MIDFKQGIKMNNIYVKLKDILSTYAKTYFVNLEITNQAGTGTEEFA